MTTIQVVIDEEVIAKAARRSVAAMFNEGDRYSSDRYTENAGYWEVVRQVKDWAKSQDYTPLIETLAPPIIREVVAERVRTVVEVEVKKAVKTLKDEGFLAEEIRKAVGIQATKGSGNEIE